MHQLYTIIQTGGKVGMRTMNQALFELYQRNEITFDEAVAHSLDPDDLNHMFSRTAGAAPPPVGQPQKRARSHG